MKALVTTLQGDPVGARVLISKAIHQTPDNWELWRLMAIHILNHHPSEPLLRPAAAHCAQKSAMMNQDASLSLSTSKSSSSSASMMSLVALLHTVMDKDLARKAAIKARGPCPAYTSEPKLNQILETYHVRKFEF